MNKLQRLKEYLENNTKEAINLINNIINGNINELKDVEIKESELTDFNGININTNQENLVLTYCAKEDANKIAYKYWMHYCQNNSKGKEITLFDKIDMDAYNLEKHHDVMEIKNKEKNIHIKIHYFYKEDLIEKELINKEDLLVLIENF